MNSEEKNIQNHAERFMEIVAILDKCKESYRRTVPHKACEEDYPPEKDGESYLITQLGSRNLLTKVEETITVWRSAIIVRVDVVTAKAFIFLVVNNSFFFWLHYYLPNSQVPIVDDLTTLIVITHRMEHLARLSVKEIAKLFGKTLRALQTNHSWKQKK